MKRLLINKKNWTNRKINTVKLENIILFYLLKNKNTIKNTVNLFLYIKKHYKKRNKFKLWFLC